MRRTFNSNNAYSSFITNTYELINRNLGNPNLIDPVPFNANETKPTMQIIEINSDETESEKQCPHNHTSNELDNNVLNINARDIRYLKHEDDIFDNNSNDENDYSNQTFDSHCGNDGNKSIYFNKIKCLTIINNNTKSDTSSDTDRYDDIEIIEFENALNDDIMWNCNNSYKTFECRDICKEEQYKWMYSSKNIKKSLDNDHELSSFSNSTVSTSTDDDDQTIDRSRVPTPIFNYIPKLNLPSSPLPTLTEVAEPNKQSLSDVTEASSNYSNIFRKSMNSSLEDGSGEDKYNQNKTSKNIQSKLSTLSEREKRRNKIAGLIDKKLDSKEQSVYCEPDFTVDKHSVSATSSVESTEKDFSATHTNITIPISEDVINDEPDTTNARNYDKHKKIQKVQIKLDTPIMRSEISDPVETLEGNWIGNGDDKKIEVYDYDFNTIDSTVESKEAMALSNKEGRANQTVNVFFKVAGHTRTPACNIPSLHLSTETDLNEDKSCFKRIFKFILCCK